MKPFMLDRLDFDLRFVELPKLGDHEVEGFLKYRIASLYPGHPEKLSSISGFCSGARHGSPFYSSRGAPCWNPAGPWAKAGRCFCPT